MAQRKAASARRIANQAARTRLLHKVIGDDALVLLLRYREVDVEDLGKVLARAHSTSADEVQTALMKDPRFELSGSKVVLAGSAERARATTAGKPRPAATIFPFLRPIA